MTRLKIDRRMMNSGAAATALALIACLTWPVFAHEINRAPDVWLELGDGKIAREPMKGAIFSCDSGFHGGGAQRTGDWLKDGKWNPSLKPKVEGDVAWPGAAITVAVEGKSRIVRANNLPTHHTGVYPVAPESEAYRFDRNPNEIAEQDILLKLPAVPQPAAKPACVPMGMIGFALSGAAIFNAFDGMGRDAPAYEIQDRCNGHPERSGQYHYHDWSDCLDRGKPDEPVGYMLDGFPILAPVDGKGREWHSADLDECHGTTGPVTMDGKQVVMYHYRFTRDFPYSIGCFKGEPVER
jgi:hypothetical protein